MKKLTVLFIALLFSAPLVFAQEEVSLDQVTGPYITFEEESFDFGDITQGDKVEHTFAFENTGTQPLVISNVKVTCGCTATEWPREPITPGASSKITVQFNSTGKMGRQNKVITVVSNATNPMARVSITGNVLPKKKDTE